MARSSLSVGYLYEVKKATKGTILLGQNGGGDGNRTHVRIISSNQYSMLSH